MKKAEKLFNEEERQGLMDALTEAESNTSGEIVPVVATASGRYDRAEDIFGVLFALVVLSVCWVFFQDIRPAQAEWSSGYTLTLGLGFTILIVALGFAVGSAAATHFPALCAPFIPRGEMLEEVERRAGESFYRFGIGNTRGSTGILIYVSLFERIVTVKGDRAISEKLNDQDWLGICQAIIAGLKRKDPASGLRSGILKSGELLSAHFPIEANDDNEIPNEIHFIG
ncbi:hypothetical protein OAO01_07290 [Oligoflexia bacterium]|nr:hypothetical protein [Oligoflexia bacterium]